MFRVAGAAVRAGLGRSVVSNAAPQQSARLFMSRVQTAALGRGLSRRFLASEAAATAAAEPIAAESLQASRNRIMGQWLMATGGLVFGVVVVGGLTRLTQSGLSITDWRPVGGSIPPLSRADWEAEFEKYKKSPEYILHNHGMTMDEFKKIFWMEWGHRQLGRFIGVTFILPYAYFAGKGWLRGRMLANATAIGGLIGFQGLLGWLMVKSGLDDKIVEKKEVARVSHYRLAAHLGTAFAIYIGAMWNGLTLLSNYGNDYRLPQTPEAMKQLHRFRFMARTMGGAVLFTALSGALVAGLDAGLVYNEFPKMGAGFIPDDLLALSPAWRNFIDNPSAVQFDHRYLGMGTASLITGVWAASKNTPLTRKSRIFLNALAGMVGVQVLLGVSTLLSEVQISLASAHQAGAMVLLSLSTHLLHTLRNLPK